MGGELRLTTNVGGDVEVVSGAGDWTLTRSNGQVVRSTVDGSEDEVEPLYNVEEEGEVEYLGRTAMAYLLVREEVPRAELVIDEETGTVVHAVTFTIDNELGLHLRAAGKFAQTAGKFASTIWVKKDGTEVNGKSIMGILSLAAACGTMITIRCTGPDAEKAMLALETLVTAKFHEG